MNSTGLKLATVGLIATVALAPVHANADFFGRISHRHDQRDQWQATAIGSAAIGLLGLAGHNNVVTAVGAAGAIYSLYRMESDCDRADRGIDRFGSDRAIGGDHRYGIDRGRDRRDDRGSRHDDRRVSQDHHGRR